MLYSPEWEGMLKYVNMLRYCKIYSRFTNCSMLITIAENIFRYFPMYCRQNRNLFLHIKTETNVYYYFHVFYWSDFLPKYVYIIYIFKKITSMPNISNAWKDSLQLRKFKEKFELQGEKGSLKNEYIKRRIIRNIE